MTQPTRSGMRTLAMTIAMCVALFAAMLAPAAAQDAPATPEGTPEAPPPPSFIIAPAGDADGSYFDIEMNAGETRELTVLLGNGGEQNVVARVYAADAYSLVNGGFGVETEEDELDGTGLWVDFEAATLELEPGETVERTVTVTVPEDATPGQYIAGMAIQTAESIAVGESSMLRQIIKKSIAIFITVPGPEEGSFEIGTIEIQQPSGASRVVVEIVNTGNILVNPSGEITITNPEGETIVTAPVNMGPVYAGDTTSIEFSLPNALPEGSYTMNIDLADEYSGFATAVSDHVAEVAAPASDVETPDPITFENVALAAIPPDGEIQALNVQLTLNNAQNSVPSGRLTMHVYKDGELVEDYQLNSSLVLPPGATEIQQRYIPLTGWESGTYSFSFTLEAVDPNSGQISTLATHEAETTIDVP